ncbi:MAG: HAMP domain-containing sensor histidine kinase [Bacteroidales bacterium]|jgi:signal transduction histidine kinase|nr:HAMP domain-containing sensor histidine kinase [Bacteroidales bacterium]MDD4087729.1 HAMP domain-containing sensor histidine kinase [Bacteroidales bacterium]MDY0086262.1 HAMP domain-containing sensor histidine kinase [Bacteroidales bacterium]
MSFSDTNSNEAFVLNTDLQGVIEKVIFNSLIDPRLALTGKNFASVLENKISKRLLDFIHQVNHRKVMVDFPINLNDQANIIHLTGVLLENKIWIVGNSVPNSMMRLINEMQLINNEQANQIRSLVKANYEESKTIDQENTSFLEELSKLNNELINTQRELSRRNAELTRLNELKNQFLGMAAHDIRNPLGVIMAYAEFLLEETKETIDEEYLSILQTIHNSAVFLLKLIEDLLDVSKIEAGKLELKKTNTDLIALAKNNIAQNNILAGKKQIEVVLDTIEKRLKFYFDPHKIEQVFNNLISNAVKFSSPGSEVHVVITRQGNQVNISVNDQGVGISKKHLNQIFLPFNLATSKGTAGEKSTGLGLFIVKTIIEGHGGKITVDSKPGRGSSFTFSLPVSLTD